MTMYFTNYIYQVLRKTFAEQLQRPLRRSVPRTAAVCSVYCGGLQRPLRRCAACTAAVCSVYCGGAHREMRQAAQFTATEVKCARGAFRAASTKSVVLRAVVAEKEFFFWYSAYFSVTLQPKSKRSKYNNYQRCVRLPFFPSLPPAPSCCKAPRYPLTRSGAVSPPSTSSPPAPARPTTPPTMSPTPKSI